MPTPRFDDFPILDWDTDAMLNLAGGVGAMRRLLREHGFPVPEPDTAYMWRSRRIPHRWIPMCVYVLLNSDKAKLSQLLRKVTPES